MKRRLWSLYDASPNKIEKLELAITLGITFLILDGKATYVDPSRR